MFIPIEQWNQLKNKFRDLEKEELDIPDWQKKELDKRVDQYTAGPEQVLNAENALDVIDNSSRSLTPCSPKNA